ncbi:hypothetical protein K6119_18250 [Paracrocinitomix mangrovi]|uniref:hypothetical protein n=1 Tax=Paracrocinitomix mangrovi TaxID=2862509 RepID=UPI001C8D6B45|nr:hypothetical protein [Paracrocinitomix mangrovi]UKN01668.1 hypothetical protein K6119_18250 [Paracrocinitomix mangrovi]
MSNLTAALIISLGGLFIGLITGLVVKKNGYSFWRYFFTGTIMGCGILGILIKILKDYL